MCFSCIHPYHSRNLHTNLWLFHTGFIGWTESVDRPYAYMTTHIHNNDHKGIPWICIQAMVVVPLIAMPYVPTVESADFGKIKKGRDDSDFSGIHPSLPLRRIYHMNKHRNAWSMDIYGCGCVFVVALAPYRPWFPSYNGFADFGKPR